MEVSVRVLMEGKREGWAGGKEESSKEGGEGRTEWSSS